MHRLSKMSVSMREGPEDDAADARGDLAVWLDDYTAGRCDRARMQSSFLDICRSNPEAPWDALALLDQYQRRGRVDAGLARSLKSDIAQLVFGVVNQSGEEPEAPPSDQLETASGDTTGTRWRRLAAERDTPGGKAEQSFVDPVQFRRDMDLPTRPPPPEIPRRANATDGTAASSVLRDRYELLTILGRGPNGTVYKALDRHRARLDPSSRCVALRVLKLNYRDSPDALAELERQFHQAQSLSHPNIVNMFDLDRDGGTYFLVMEFLEGELLSDILHRLRREPMQRDRALAIIGSIGAGLSHAHRRGVVHSDLRPGNVMIAANGEVKVMDIGFVRRTHADPQRFEPWIGDPALGGKPGVNLAYASEERVNGESPDPADDVYSLACIAYELLSGQHPYGGRSAPLARAHGRAPQRIPGLTGRQWSALQTALRWSRADRKIDVVELVAGLGCADITQRLAPPQDIVAGDAPRRFGTFGKFSIALLVLVAAGAAFLAFRDRLNFALPVTTAQQPEAVVTPPDLPQADIAPETVATEPPPVQQAPAMGAAAPPPAAAQPEDAKTPPQVAAAERQAPAVAKPAGGGVARISFDKDTFVATESDGSVKLTVRRSGSSRNAVTFHWKLMPNSAEAGGDFAAIGPGVETIPAGANSVALIVPLVSDSLKESTELFLAEISPADDTTELGELSRAAVIVVDDD